MALLQHVNEPYPSSLVPVLALSGKEKFASAFLISPSSPYSFGSASIIQNPVTDMISGKVLEGLWAVVMSTNAGIGEKEGDRYLVPLLSTSEGAWKGLRVERITVVAGSSEVLKGDIVQVGERMQVGAFRFLDGDFEGWLADWYFVVEGA